MVNHYWPERIIDDLELRLHSHHLAISHYDHAIDRAGALCLAPAQRAGRLALRHLLPDLHTAPGRQNHGVPRRRS